MHMLWPIAAAVWRTTERASQCIPARASKASDFSCLRKGKGVFDFNAEIPDGGLDL